MALTLGERQDSAQWLLKKCRGALESRLGFFRAAVFGSFCTGQLHPESDVDLLLVLDNARFPKKAWDRTTLFHPVLREWHDHRPFLSAPFTLSPLILAVDAWNRSRGLHLSLSENAWVLQDDGILSEPLRAAQAERWAGRWDKIATSDGGWIWAPKGVPA